MDQEKIQTILEKFYPILLFMALVLISGGFFLIVYFSFSVYELFVHPEQSIFMDFILKNLPSAPDKAYVFEMINDGKHMQISIPSAFLSYARVLFAFVIWLMLGRFISDLFSSGIAILKLFHRAKTPETSSVTTKTKSEVQ